MRNDSPLPRTSVFLLQRSCTVGLEAALSISARGIRDHTIDLVDDLGKVCVDFWRTIGRSCEACNMVTGQFRPRVRALSCAKASL